MLTDKQQEYLRNCNHRWNLKLGAVRSGKTFLDFSTVIPLRVTHCRGEGQILFLGVTQQTVNRNVLEPLRDIWGESLCSRIRYDNSIKIFGKKAYVLGADKRTAVDKIRGMTLEYAYIDEAAGINKEVWEMLKSRLSTAHAHCDATANPADPGHWLKKFIDTPDLDIYVQHYTIDDNPMLPPAYVENLKREYAGTVFYPRYILGEWSRAEGIIYRAFADDLATGGSRFFREKIPEDLRIEKVTIGVDFGGNGSKHAFVATVFTTDHRIIPVMSQRIEPYGTDADYLGKAFHDFSLAVFSRYHRIDAVYVDSAEQVLKESLRSSLRWTRMLWLADYIYNSKKIPIIDRIRLVTVLQNSGRFFILPEAKTLSDALGTALWDEKSGMKDQRLDDGSTDIDSLDAFEYSIERDYKTLLNLN